MKEFFKRNIVDFVKYMELGVLFTIAFGIIFPSVIVFSNPTLFLALILISSKLDIYSLQKKLDER